MQPRVNTDLPEKKNIGRNTMKTKMPLFVFLLLFLVGTVPTATVHAGEPVRMAYLQGDIHHLALWVALDKGMFEKEGVDVEVAGIFKAGPEEMTAFVTGDLDMGYVGEAPATTAVANGAARVTALAQVNTEGSAVVVRRDSPAKGLQDLVGKGIAVPGHSTVQDLLLRKGLAGASIMPKQARIIVLKPPEMINALRTKQIDAFVAWEPYPSKARTMEVGRVLVSSGQIWDDHPCCVLIADNRFLDSHPDEVKAVLRAHAQATDYINLHPGEAAKIGVKYTGMDEETIKAAMEHVNYTVVLNMEGEKEYVDFLTGLKYIEVKDVHAFVRKFIRPEILGEILDK